MQLYKAQENPTAGAHTPRMGHLTEYYKVSRVHSTLYPPSPANRHVFVFSITTIMIWLAFSLCLWGGIKKGSRISHFKKALYAPKI